MNQDGEYLFEVMEAGKSNGNDIRWQYVMRGIIINYLYDNQEIINAISHRKYKLMSKSKAYFLNYNENCAYNKVCYASICKQ